MSVRDPGYLSRANGVQSVDDHFWRGLRLIKKKKKVPGLPRSLARVLPLEVPEAARDHEIPRVRPGLPHAVMKANIIIRQLLTITQETRQKSAIGHVTIRSANCLRSSTG